MTRTMLLALAVLLPVYLGAETRAHEQGVIVRMRTADCLVGQHPLMDALSGTSRGPVGEQCPEYVLVSDKVVYVIIGKTSDQLVPLAESTFFRVQNNELLIRVDDARHETHFHVKEMVLRPEWERSRKIEEATAAAAHQRMQNAMAVSRDPE